jgi:hypothetical protein
VAIWNGEKVLVIRRELSEPSRAATFDPCTERWAEVEMPERVGRFGNAPRVIGRRVLALHTLPPNEGAVLLSDPELRAFSPASPALVDGLFTEVGAHLVKVTSAGSWIDFSETRIGTIDGAERRVTGPTPPRRTQHGIAMLPDGFFLFGGWENPPGRHLSDAYVLSVSDATWTALPGEGAPTMRSPLAVERIGEAVVVWSGRDQDGLRPDGAVFDIGRGRWSPMASESAPTPTDDALIAVAGGRLYVLGGHLPCHQCVGEAIRGGASYDPATDRWRPISFTRDVDRTFTRAHPLDDGRLLLRHRDLTWIAVYDPTADGWTDIDPGPVARRAHAAIAWTGRRLFVWGGLLLGPVMPNQCQNTPPNQGCDPVGPERSYPPGGAILAP